MKKSSLFKTKCMVFLLAILLCATCLAACNDGGEEQGTTLPNTTETPPEQDSGLDENGFVKSSLPANLNLDKNVNILYWSDYYDSLYCGDDYKAGEIVDDASYNRDRYTEEYLNVFLKWVPTLGGGYSNAANFVQEVTNQSNSGDGTQLIAGYSRCMTTLAIQGMLKDTNRLQTNYIDLEKPWWTEEMAYQLKLGQSNYLYTGDISGDLITSMISVFYNMDMINDLGMDNPIELVRNQEWTYERMLEMASTAYHDEGGDSIIDEGDRLGLGFVEWSTTAFYVGLGNRIIDNYDGYLVLSDDYSGEPAIDFVEKAMELLNTKGVAKLGAGEMRNSFVSKNLLFMTYELRIITQDVVRNSGLKIGVLPTPMAESGNNRYYTYPGLNYTVWGILGTLEDSEATDMTAVLECMGGHAHRELLPAIFEYGFMLRYSADNDVAEMYQLVRDSLSFDFGFLFARAVMSDIDLAYQLSDSAWAGTSWTTTFAQTKTMLLESIRKLNDLYD